MNLIVYYKDIYKKQCKPKLDGKPIVNSVPQEHNNEYELNQAKINLFKNFISNTINEPKFDKTLLNK